MGFQKRLCLRKFRLNWKKMRRRKLNLSLIVVLLVLSIVWLVQRGKYATPSCSQIDVVYTWVNGSDPDFIQSARHFNPAYDAARFDDKNELRYSLRSLEMYAPWIRHIYIVTNGQIPHWLDLSYSRVTIVPHEVLSPTPQHLPTFSSPAIETFLHRIPNLSERFLYINDDIFLGAPLYPEDLHTESEGVRIYQAWLVPDCSVDCPWTYIGDGDCDRHCNIAECQYDGGDCIGEANAKSDKIDLMVRHDVDVAKMSKKKSTTTNEEPNKRNNNTRTEIRNFPLRKRFRRKKSVPAKANASSSFKDIVKSKNLTTLNELRQIVNSYNSNKTKDQAHRDLVSVDFKESLKPSPTTTNHSRDIFSESLIHTNMLLNRIYGFKARYVLAHVGFLLERNIIAEMQKKFPREIEETARSRFRTPHDLQFAFAYYSFVMSESRTVTVEEIFDEFDTDGSTTWSDREIRTFLARTFLLPLDWSAVRFFEDVVGNCSRDLGFDRRPLETYTTLVYERYEDSNVPTITRELVGKCPMLAEALASNFGNRAKYKFNNLKRSNVNNFMMLTSNVSNVVDGLDYIRRNPRKFNCINDNLDAQNSDDNELIRHLLEDFYLSFFPRRSKFELKPEYRNRYSTWQDYQRWRRRKRAALCVGYVASFILIAFVFRFVCMHKAKFVRRYVQKI